MRGLVLFTLVTWVTFSSSQSQTKFAGLMDMFDRFFIDGFGFCGAICLAPNLHEHVNKTLYQCQNNMEAIDMEYYTPGWDLDIGDNYYNYVIKRQGSSNSTMCRWAHSMIDGCVGKLVKDHCDHDGIKREMSRMMQQAIAYLCSLDPPMLECAFHPEVIKSAWSCGFSLHEQFEEYFTTRVYVWEQRVNQFQAFYNGEIKTNHSESLYRAFKTLGTCVSTLVSQPTIEGKSCSKVKDLIDKEIDSVIAYFKKTDMLKCNFDPELWGHMEECAVTFGKALEDRAVTPDPSRYKDSSRRYDPVAHTVEQFRHFADDDYQLLKDPLKAFKTCTLTSINTVCGKKWTYDVTNTQLTLLENIFNPKDKTVPQHCEAVIQEQMKFSAPSSAGTSTAVAVTVAAAVFLRVL